MRKIRRSVERNAKKRAMKAAVSAMMLAGGVMMACPSTLSNVQAATEHWNDASASKSESWNLWKENWDKYSKNYENVSLTPGADETQLNFAYYSKTAETPKVKIATNKDMTDAKEVEGAQTEAVQIDGEQYYSNKATVEGLKENTTYYYQVFQDGKYQDAQKYATKSFQKYSFLYVGDPQIGASSGQTSTDGEVMKNNNLAARNDGYNWNNVLNNAVKRNPQLSFVASAGDQVNTNNNEVQYAAYLGADALRSLPVATTIGNHDSASAQYSMHYNNPNAFDTSGYKNKTQYTEGHTAAGTDYYYTYGNTLFIVLDTNNYNCATHGCHTWIYDRMYTGNDSSRSNGSGTAVRNEFSGCSDCLYLFCGSSGIIWNRRIYKIHVSFYPICCNCRSCDLPMRMYAAAGKSN